MRQAMRILSWSCAVILATGIASTDAEALLEPDLTVDKLTNQSDLVLTGTITGVEVEMGLWAGVDHEIPVTRVEITVNETWKGVTVNDTVTFTIPGGEIPGGAKVMVSNTPEVSRGEKAIVFLSYVLEGGYYMIYGWENGIFPIVEDTAGREIVRSHHNHNVEDGGLKLDIRNRVMEIERVRGGVR